MMPNNPVWSSLAVTQLDATLCGRAPAEASWVARCRELAAVGIDGLAHPRSRLSSTEGLMTAHRYVAYLNQPQSS